MSNGNNSINFENTSGEALLAPFINLQAKYFEAELNGDMCAVNSLCESYRALSTMTLNKQGGAVVTELTNLKNRIHTLCNQWVSIQVASMRTHDEDQIENLRAISKNAIEEAKCVLSRVIIKICTQSFSNTVMLGCTIKDVSKLAYDVETEAAEALQGALNTLVTLGMEEVAVAVSNNSDLEMPSQQELTQLSDVERRARLCTRHILTEEERRYNFAQFCMNCNWQVQYNEEKTVYLRKRALGIL